MDSRFAALQNRCKGRMILAGENKVKRKEKAIRGEMLNKGKKVGYTHPSSNSLKSALILLPARYLKLLRRNFSSHVAVHVQLYQ